MAEPAVKLLDDDAVVLRRAGVRFPLELRPSGFSADDLKTWPEAEGRLEWLEGRLLYMPPCADIQHDVAVDVVHLLRTWSEAHPDFVIGGNEAGMKLGTDVRAADAAVWRRADLGPSVGRLGHTAPLLAVEVAGQDEDESVLRSKAEWYLRNVDGGGLTSAARVSGSARDSRRRGVAPPSGRATDGSRVAPGSRAGSGSVFRPARSPLRSLAAPRAARSAP